MMTTYLQDPTFYWLLWGVVTLIGVVVGWHMRAGWSERAVIEALDNSEQERNALARLYAQVRDQNELREADLKKANLELNSLRQEISRVQVDKAATAAERQAAAARVAQAEAAVAHYAEKLKLLEEQVMHLRQYGDQANAEVAHLQEELKAWRVLYNDFSALQRQMQGMQANTANIEAERDQLRQQLQIARSEVEHLQIELMRTPVQNDPPGRHAHPNGERFTGPANQVNAPAHADDLRHIEGITTYAQQQLYALGIFTFAQISRWDNANIAAISKAIGVPPAKIVQEDWVGQAQHLLSGYQP